MKILFPPITLFGKSGFFNKSNSKSEKLKCKMQSLGFAVDGAISSPSNTRNRGQTICILHFTICIFN